MIIESSAPPRVDLAGGTIDIWPLYLFHPGAITVNFAISLHARCRIETRDDGRIVLESRDRKVSFRIGTGLEGVDHDSTRKVINIDRGWRSHIDQRHHLGYDRDSIVELRTEGYTGLAGAAKSAHP